MRHLVFDADVGDVGTTARLPRDVIDALVPIDRDPVPPQFAEGVRRYYERLGSGQ